MLDLSTLDVVAAAERAVRVELESPVDGEPLLDLEGKPFYVEVLGEDSAVVTKIDRKHADRRSERIRKGQTWNTDSESLRTEAAERLTAATVSWYLPPRNGESMPFTPQNARALYLDDRLAWIAEQVTKAMKDRKRFFSAVSTS